MGYPDGGRGQCLYDKKFANVFENYVFGFEWDPYQNLTVTTQILQDEMYDLYDIPSRHYDTTFPTKV